MIFKEATTSHCLVRKARLLESFFVGFGVFQGWRRVRYRGRQTLTSGMMFAGVRKFPCWSLQWD